MLIRLVAGGARPAIPAMGIKIVHPVMAWVMKSSEENDTVEQIQREGMKSPPVEAGGRIRAILIYEWGLLCNEVVVRFEFWMEGSLELHGLRECGLGWG